MPELLEYLNIADVVFVLLIWLGAAIVARVIVLRAVSSLARRTRYRIDRSMSPERS